MSFTIPFFRPLLTISMSFYLCCSFAQQVPQDTLDPHWVKHVLTTDFISEGVAIGDVNRDGKPDILAGAYWFEAPQWTRHEIAAVQHFSYADGYSNSFLDFTMDVNQDGWVDLIRISLPGEEAVWYENPQNKAGHWKMHPLLNYAGNESPALVDVDGDGRPDLLCNDPVAKEMIWLKSPARKGDTLWQRTVIGKGAVPGLDRYTHGLGFHDMNGDGRKDVIITKGWWECPVDPRQPNWVFHPTDLGEECSQIYALDVKGDGSPAFVTASAHDYGIWWHEPVGEKDGGVWEHHLISKKFSESHALALGDINGDGHPDLVTGKRYYAHNGGDPGGKDAAVLYWFEFHPGKEPRWIPHLIDTNSGVGLQVVPIDLNGDGLMDIVEANKKGVYFFEQKK